MKIENERIVFKNDRFFKARFIKMVVLIKLVVSLTIVNDDFSLKIVNEERKPT